MTTEQTQGNGQFVASGEQASASGERTGTPPGKVDSAVDAALSLALFQPDMAANVAAAMRLAACLAMPISIIEPAGFVFDRKRLRRVGMDYIDEAPLQRFPSWRAFEEQRRASGRRLVLLTTSAEQPYHRARFQAGDILLGGQESAGVPDEVHQAADLRVLVPMAPDRRSLNLVTALAMVLGEALRQTDGFPQDTRLNPWARPGAAAVCDGEKS